MFLARNSEWFRINPFTIPETATAKSLQSCPTLCDPIDGSHQAPPSLGFSRQEHWSGLPFPSPMHESEKWKWSRSVMSDSSDPMDCSPPGSSIHGIFQARVLVWGDIAFSMGSPKYLLNKRKKRIQPMLTSIDFASFSSTSFYDHWLFFLGLPWLWSVCSTAISWGCFALNFTHYFASLVIKLWN